MSESAGSEGGTVIEANASDDGRRRSRLETVRMGVFSAVALLVVAMAAAFVGFLMQWAVEAWFTTRFGDHRIHQIVDGTLVGALTLGVLVQLHRPRRRVAAMQASVVVIVLFSAIALAGGGLVEEVAPFLVLTLLLGALHPAGREMIRPFTAGRFSPRLAGLVAVALVPLAVYAAQQFGLQLVDASEHAAFGHWGNEAASALTVVALGLLASLKTRMWLWPAAVAGVLAGVHGLASVLFDTASSVGVMWGGLELAWALVFLAVAVAEYRGAPVAEARESGAGAVGR